MSTHGRKRQAPKDDDTATAGSIQDVCVNVKRIHVRPINNWDVKRRSHCWGTGNINEPTQTSTGEVIFCSRGEVEHRGTSSASTNDEVISPTTDARPSTAVTMTSTAAADVTAPGTAASTVTSRDRQSPTWQSSRIGQTAIEIWLF